MTLILCVCRRGNVRSACAARLLKDNWSLPDVVALGVDTTTPETWALLGPAAKAIVVVADQPIYDRVPSEYRVKTIHLDIGDDTWGNSFNGDLSAILTARLTSIIPNLT